MWDSSSDNRDRLTGVATQEALLRFAAAALENAAPQGPPVCFIQIDVDGLAAVREESGAAVSDAFGRKLDYNKRDPRAFGLIASAPGIHGATVDHLSDRAATFSRA